MSRDIKKSNRVVYMDILRVIATFAVIILHVAAQKYRVVSIESSEWMVFNFVSSAVRWAVPIFVMISGALFLDNERTVNVKKNIRKMVTVFLFWSAFYAGNKMLTGNGGIKEMVLAFIQGNYHMWFLFTICGLYMIVPILRKITESKEVTEYLLEIGFVFSYVIPRTIRFVKNLDIPHTKSLLNAVNDAFLDVKYDLTSGYVLYFVLGYYLYKYELDEKKRKGIYVLGILGYAATVLLTIWWSGVNGEANTDFCSAFSINVFCMAAALFVFGKYEISKIHWNQRVLDILLNISKYSFGIYLIHVFVIEKLNIWFGFHTLTFHPVLSVPALVAVVFVISYFISFCLHKIPGLKRYIV